MKKRVLALAMATIMASSSIVFATSPAEGLADLGIIQKSVQGYNEQSQITRAEFLVILSKLYGITDISTYKYKNQFKDVNLSDWYASYVQFALDNKITSGLSATSFGPNATLTYEQAALFMVRALGYESSFEGSLGKAFDLKLLNGVTVKIGTPITRGEVFIMAENTLAQPYNGDRAALKNKLGLINGQKYRNQNQLASYGFNSVRSVTDKVVEVKFENSPQYLMVDEIAISNGVNNAKSIFKVDEKTYLVEMTNSINVDTTISIGKDLVVKPLQADKGRFIIIANSSMARSNKSLVLQFNKPVDYLVLSQLGKFKFDNDLQATSVSYFKDSNGQYDYAKLLVITNGQTDGKMYNLSLKELTDMTGMTLMPRVNNAEFQFGGVKADSTSPMVDRAYTKTNKEVYLVFKDETGIEAMTAADPLNYAIKTSDKGESLKINSVTVLPDRFGIIKEVKLNTDLMTGNTGYIVEAKNIKDIDGNIISTASNYRTSLASRARDTERPSIADYVNLTANKIKLTFNEEITKTSAENLENYRFDQEVKVTKATLSELDNKTVYLETTDQPTGKNFQLYVSYVEDLFGNAMPKNDGRAYFFGNGGNLTKPKALTAEAQLYGGRSAVVVSFSKDMDMTTLLDKNNYVFSKLGTALYVEKINEQQVKVYTEDQVKFEKYDLTITNVLDNTFIGLNGGSQTISFYGTSL